MSKKLAGELAATEAERLIAEWGLTSLPIDPFEIAKRHNIMVVAKPAEAVGVSGFLTRIGDNFVIAHASNIKNDGFIRFTVSHELGHYFLPEHPERLFPGGNGIHHSRSGFISDDINEVEADHFAAALLMPEGLFREAMSSAGEGFPAIEALSRQCKTSITATAIRYAKFAEDPVAVVVSSGKIIDYCFMSGALRDVKGIEWIKKGTLLPRRCETIGFNQNAENVTSGETAEGWSRLDDWFEGAPPLDIKEDVVGLGTYGKTLTVLFSDGVVDEQDDEDDED